MEYTHSNVIEKMLTRLVEQYHPIKVILFGSYATGNLTEDSNIDLLIIKETQENFIDLWCTVGRVLAGTHPSIPVDTFILTPQEVENRLFKGDQFISDIIKNGKILYAA